MLEILIVYSLHFFHFKENQTEALRNEIDRLKQELDNKDSEKDQLVENVNNFFFCIKRFHLLCACHIDDKLTEFLIR